MNTDGAKTFGLIQPPLGLATFVEIPEERSKALRAAKHVVIQVLLFEEKFDLMVGNYLEFETTLNSLGAEQMIRHKYDYHSLHEMRMLVNRRINNLLSGCSLYLDHGGRHLASIESAIPGLRADFDTVRRAQFDNYASYRIGQLLRNHSQHRAFPVSAANPFLSWVERSGDDKVLLHGFEVPLDINSLRSDPELRADTRQDIEALAQANALNARPILREYVARLGVLHDEMRKRIDAVVRACEEEIRSAIALYKSTRGPQDSIVGLAVVDRDKDGRWSNADQLFEAFIERRQQLVQSTSSLAQVHVRHVTSEPRPRRQ